MLDLDFDWNSLSWCANSDQNYTLIWTVAFIADLCLCCCEAAIDCEVTAYFSSFWLFNTEICLYLIFAVRSFCNAFTTIDCWNYDSVGMDINFFWCFDVRIIRSFWIMKIFLFIVPKWKIIIKNKLVTNYRNWIIVIFILCFAPLLFFVQNFSHWHFFEFNKRKLK